MIPHNWQRADDDGEFERDPHAGSSRRIADISPSYIPPTTRARSLMPWAKSAPGPINTNAPIVYFEVYRCLFKEQLENTSSAEAFNAAREFIVAEHGQPADRFER